MFKTTKFAAIVTLCFLARMSAHDHDLEPECKTFLEIYGNAKTMAGQMWNGAFTYETNENLAFDMWFLNQPNPNIAKVDVVNNSLPANKKLYDIDQCHLESYHKDFPTIDDHPHHQPESFTECLPWRERACCSSDTVSSVQKLKEGYGEEYHWDRCGPLSPACGRFFVQEACFYECEPAAGLYRKYPEHIFDENDDDHNKWQMHGMPIKASFWEEWFAACRNDKFCAHAGGDYFACAAQYVVAKEARLQAEAEEARAEAASTTAEPTISSSSTTAAPTTSSSSTTAEPNTSSPSTTAAPTTSSSSELEEEKEKAEAEAARLEAELEEERERAEAEAARLEAELEAEREKSGQLSGGAIAGMAVGCSVALGALGCAMVMFIKQRPSEPAIQPLTREATL